MNLFLMFRIFILLVSLLVLSGFGFGQNLKLRAENRNPKVRQDIRELVAKIKKIEKNSRFSSSGLTEYSTPRFRVDKRKRIQAYIYLTDFSAVVLERFSQLGIAFDIVNRRLGMAQVWLPPDQIERVAAELAVELIELPDYAITLTGSVNSEGDALLLADQVRRVHGKDGSGIRVGVISDGVDSRGEAQATQDLPDSLDIDPTLSGEGEEGTAMLEIIHDLAPAAELAFSGPATSLEMIDAIDYLAHDAFAGQGCDVIVDDLGFLSQPAFEDGAIALAVEDVVAEGTIYVTSAGNQADVHYEHDYSPGTLDFDGSVMVVHDFGKAIGQAGDVGQDILVGANSSLTVVLQWNDPFSRANNDYDLLIFNAGFTEVLAISERPQDGHVRHSPIEFATYDNVTAASVQVHVVIRNFGAEDLLLEMFYTGEDFSLQEFRVAEGSIIPGQQMAKAAITVGAISVLDPGVNTIEFFSSLGPVRIFSPTTETRTKPDLVAVDGVAITGAGGFGSNFNGTKRFFGTSASAPHAAAVAALLLSGQPDLAPADIRAALQNTAVDYGAAGLDNTYGAGKIDALAAFQQILTSVPFSEPVAPQSFWLQPNYPNPFNPTTTIRYAVPPVKNNATVRLDVINASGQMVKTLVDAPQTAGIHQIDWNGKNEAGRSVASGLYMLRLQSGDFISVRKALLLR